MSRPLAFLASPLGALLLAVVGATMATGLPRPESLILGAPCLLAGLVLLFRHQQVVEPRNLQALTELEAELQALRRQQHQENQLRGEILRNLMEGVVVLGADHRIRLFNPAAQRLLGGSGRMSQGATLPELLREPEGLRQAEAAYEGRAAEWLLRRDPAVIRVRTLPFPLGEEGMGILITLDDVTRQEALETTRQKFISNASHELRTPVTAIRIAAENLADGEQVLPEGLANLNSVLRAVDRMTLLLDDISELSRIETGALHLEPEPVDIAAFARQMVEDQGPQARAKGIALNLSLGPGAEGSHLEVDPLRLDQLLSNLLGNAIKFSPEGSCVELGVEVEGGQAFWKVRDQGPGISQADLRRIFERFYRARATRGVPGTGLGLAIVKHLAHLMGGDVGVESEVGRGSTFTLRLPIQAS